ncbi:DET1 homolog [Anneissia japonica]|uniref:DET1 homolog n=1 Tax=Anneissia japonica TaxID=1529436 RepID=UPI0014255E0D|nr:DET1 homolog [Anneissia japonica]
MDKVDAVVPDDNTTEMLNQIRPRKIPNQNIVYRLRQRETHIRKPCTQFHCARQFHQNIFPNYTIVNLKKPPCFLRKFSPDGQYFIAFSADQTSLEIYEFRGSQAAGELLKNANGHMIKDDGDPESHKIRNNIFERFFRLKHTVNVAPNGEHLNRECSLFTDDGRYVIVGSAVFIPEDRHFFDIYRNNESISPNPKFMLEDYSLHIIDLESGILCDTRTFKCDKIFLSHNQGIYLFKNILAVLSVQQQTIHIFHVTSDGSFIDVQTIGRFCFEDDALVYSSLRVEPPHPSHRQDSQYSDPTINSLKHRLLVFLYRKAHNQGTPESSRHFFRYYHQFRSLRMWKMQLLDEDHLLIKYSSEAVVSLLSQDPNSLPSFFVVYNMVTTEVIAVFDNTSKQLLELFENFGDLFRNASLHTFAQFTCSSNIYARQIQERFKHTIINAKFGGHTEAVKRLLAQLPISSQSYSSSPYLDLALFSYDDKWVSAMERPKTCGDHPIRFYARDSGLLRFRIQAGGHGRPTSQQPTPRRLVAFTFHPHEPFAISVQRTNAEYVVNFHVRHPVALNHDVRPSKTGIPW